MLTAIELHAPGAFDPDTRWHLGSQAPGGHSTASGAAELHARTHQYIATVFAAGGRFWRNGSTTKCDRLGARPNSSDEPIHGHPELCQRLLHDGAVSFSFSCLAISSCTASSRYCRASAASAR